jgi:hypothetical protein
MSERREQERKLIMYRKKERFYDSDCHTFPMDGSLKQYSNRLYKIIFFACICVVVVAAIGIKRRRVSADENNF